MSKIALKPAFTMLFTLLLATAFAHETRFVGEGEDQYNVIVGMVREPVFSGERNGLDLIIRRADNDEPVENLEASLSAEFVAPDGQATRALTLRGQYGRPGYYTDDILLTQPGIYQIRIFGFIGALEVDEAFETHEVRELAEISFP